MADKIKYYHLRKSKTSATIHENGFLLEVNLANPWESRVRELTGDGDTFVRMKSVNCEGIPQGIYSFGYELKVPFGLAVHLENSEIPSKGIQNYVVGDFELSVPNNDDPRLFFPPRSELGGSEETWEIDEIQGKEMKAIKGRARNFYNGRLTEGLV